MRTPDHIDVPSSNERVAAMRGGDAVGVAPRAWVVVGALALLVVGALLAISVISAANDNARITRMKDHGIAVTAVASSMVEGRDGSATAATCDPGAANVDIAPMTSSKAVPATAY